MAVVVVGRRAAKRQAYRLNGESLQRHIANTTQHLYTGSKANIQIIIIHDP